MPYVAGMGGELSKNFGTGIIKSRINSGFEIFMYVIGGINIRNDGLFREKLLP